MKEKDLEGHLEGEDQGKAEEAKKENKLIEKIKISEPAGKPEEGEDIQLKRALDYLKSWYIFKSTSQKVS